MSTPSEFKRSLEYRDRTRSNSRNFDYQTQQVINALERGDERAAQALLNQRQ